MYVILNSSKVAIQVCPKLDAILIYPPNGHQGTAKVWRALHFQGEHPGIPKPPRGKAGISQRNTRISWGYVGMG